MTVSATETTQNSYTAAAAQDQFEIRFKWYEAEDVEVYVDDVLQASGYSVSIDVGEDPDASNDANVVSYVVFDTPLAGGEAVLLKQNINLNQQTDYLAFGGFPAESHENALDKLTLIAKYLKGLIDDADISSIVSDVDSLESDVSDLQTDVGGFNSRITVNENDIATLDTRVGAAETDTAAALAAATSADSQATSNASDIADLQDADTTLATNISANAADIAALEALPHKEVRFLSASSGSHAYTPVFTGGIDGATTVYTLFTGAIRAIENILVFKKGLLHFAWSYNPLTMELTITDGAVSAGSGNELVFICVEDIS